MTRDQEEWVERMVKKPPLKGIGSDSERRAYLGRLVELSGGRCRWTGLPLKFDTVSAGGQNATDPLYAEVDHREPGSNDHGHDLVCHRINDAKGQIPWRVWLEASQTESFREWMADLQREWTRTGTLKGPESLQR